MKLDFFIIVLVLKGYCEEFCLNLIFNCFNLADILFVISFVFAILALVYSSQSSGTW